MEHFHSQENKTEWSRIVFSVRLRY